MGYYLPHNCEWIGFCSDERMVHFEITGYLFYMYVYMYMYLSLLVPKIQFVASCIVLARSKENFLPQSKLL